MLPPAVPSISQPSSESNQLRQEQIKNIQAQQDYQLQRQMYNRNVSIIALGLSVVTLVLSLAILKGVELFANSLMLSGLFILIYAIIRGFGNQDERFRFMVVGIGLLIALMIGYLKLIKFPTT